MLVEKQDAPDFTTITDQGDSISLSNFKGKKVVLFFYPKDDTPGCTVEACNFRDNFATLNQLGIVVLGVSKDTQKSHEKFKEKYQLNFPLIVDDSAEICSKYDVLKEKSMFGKKYMGIERTTFLIDEQGKIEKIWRNVKVDVHVEEIIEMVRN